MHLATAGSGLAPTGPGATAVQSRIEAGTVVLFTDNTTVGYALFNRDRQELEYIFVHPDYRGRGHGRQLVTLAEEVCDGSLKPAEPLSPSGIAFFRALGS